VARYYTGATLIVIRGRKRPGGRQEGEPRRCWIAERAARSRGARLPATDTRTGHAQPEREQVRGHNAQCRPGFGDQLSTVPTTSGARRTARRTTAPRRQLAVQVVPVGTMKPGWRRGVLLVPTGRIGAARLRPRPVLQKQGSQGPDRCLAPRHYVRDGAQASMRARGEGAAVSALSLEALALRRHDAVFDTNTV